MKKLTHVQVVARVKALHPRIKLLTKYVNTRTPVKIRCMDCGNTENKYANNLINHGRGCSVCSNAAHPARQLMPAKEIEGKMLKATNYRIVGGSVTDGGREYVEVECKVCGWRGSVRPFIYRNSSKHYQHGCCIGSTSVGNSLKQASRIKNLRLGGKTFHVRGYEPYALAYLVKQKGISSKELVTSSKNIPRIPYVYGGKHRTHVPDIFIPTKNILVEVKSVYTAGLLKPSDREHFCWETLKQKSINAKLLGYKYRVLIMDCKGERVVLPKDWETYTHDKIRAWYSAK
jgi:hypothetical protein